VDDDLKETTRLDAVVTVVDAKHLLQHLDEVKPEDVVNEAGASRAAGGRGCGDGWLGAAAGPAAGWVFLFLLLSLLQQGGGAHAAAFAPQTRQPAEKQVAFADRILLNKTDLVSKQDLANVKRRIRVRARGCSAFLVM